MGQLVNESRVSGFGGKDTVQQELEPQRDLRRSRQRLLCDRKFQMLPGRGPLDGSCPLGTIGTFGDPNTIALRVVDGERILSADLAVAYLERVLHLTGQGTGVRQWSGVA